MKRLIAIAVALVAALAPANGLAQRGFRPHPYERPHEDTSGHASPEAQLRALQDLTARAQEERRQHNDLESVKQLPASEENFYRAQAAMRFLHNLRPYELRAPAITLAAGENVTDYLNSVFVAPATEPSYMNMPADAAQDGFSNKALVVDFLPESDADFETIFRRTPSAADAAAYRAGRRVLANLPAGFPAGMNAAFNSVGRVVIFLGHNEGGGIVSRNGVAIDLEETAQRCRVTKKLCFFVVCNSQRAVRENAVGVDGNISIRDGIELVRRMTKFLSEAETNPDGSLKYPQWTTYHLLRIASEGDNKVMLLMRQAEGYLSLAMVVISPGCAGGSAKCTVH